MINSPQYLSRRNLIKNCHPALLVALQAGERAQESQPKVEAAAEQPMSLIEHPSRKYAFLRGSSHTPAELLPEVVMRSYMRLFGGPCLFEPDFAPSASTAVSS